MSRRERAILMGKDNDAFNRWEAGQTLAAEIMLEGPQAAATPMTDYIAAIGDVLARAEDDPAFAAQMLMPPTENELAARKTPVDPVAIHHGAACAGARHRARPSRPPGPALRAYARCRRFQPRRQIGRAARLAQCLPALSHRRR